MTTPNDHSADDSVRRSDNRSTSLPPSGPPPSYPPPSGSSNPSRHVPSADADQFSADVLRMGQFSFKWPVPDRHVALADRALHVEVLVVAGLWLFAFVWLVVGFRDVWAIVPDGAEGLFGERSEYVVGFATFAALGPVVYVIGLCGWCGVLELQGSPAATPVAQGVVVILGLFLFVDARPGAVVGAWILACVAVGATYVSPRLRRIRRRQDDGNATPASIAAVRLVSFAFFGLAAVICLVALWGVRFPSENGVTYYLTLFGLTVSTSLGLIGARRLDTPDRVARILLSVALFGPAIVIVFWHDLGGLFVATFLGFIGSVALPLWALTSVRGWFGDRPLVTLMPAASDRTGGSDRISATTQGDGLYDPPPDPVPIRGRQMQVIPRAIWAVIGGSIALGVVVALAANAASPDSPTEVLEAFVEAETCEQAMSYVADGDVDSELGAMLCEVSSDQWLGIEGQLADGVEETVAGETAMVQVAGTTWHFVKRDGEWKIQLGASVF